MLNVKLLREVLDYIKANPQKWNQDAWFKVSVDKQGEPIFNKVTLQFEEVNSCNTALCFAGHAALMSGFDAPPRYDYEVWRGWGPGLPKGERMDVDQYATEVLGLSTNQADVLFNGDNSLEDLERIVGKLIENPKAWLNWDDSEDDPEAGRCGDRSCGLCY